MNIQTKIYIAIAAAALLMAVTLGTSYLSGREINRLERRIDEASQTADAAERKAAERELDASVFREKIAYLESLIANTRAEAGKQDEKIKNQRTVTDNARADVARARRVGSSDASAEELCAKLAALGHPCG